MVDNAIVQGAATSRSGTQVFGPMKMTEDAAQLQMPGYADYAMRGQMFSFSVAAVTLPVNAGTLASKMGLYNPPNSGVFVEIIDVEAHYVVATTVVNAVGLYYSNGSNATGATFTTPGTALNARVGEGPASVATPYSAVTHVGTPALIDIIGGWGAVTDSGSTPIRKQYGLSTGKRILLPPATLLAVAMTTAASTASGFTGTITWVEIPYRAL